MAQSKLEIILRAIYQGQGLRQAKDDLKALDQQSAKALKNWRNMIPGLATVGVAIGGVAVAARGAWQALEGGAALLETERKFDRLAASIGTTGEALRNELGGSIGLLMTQGEQMGLATNLMSLGLAKTSEEATRLARVTAELGMDMGQLALTLTNQTTMRFDQMNMRVDGFAERLEKLKAAGYSADEAFKWAFIEQAEAQVELVGGKSESAAGKVEMLTNMWDGAKESFMASFADAAIQQIDAVGTEAETTASKINALTASWGAFLGSIPGMFPDGLLGGFSASGVATREKMINGTDPFIMHFQRQYMEQWLSDPSLGIRTQGNAVGGLGGKPRQYGNVLGYGTGPNTYTSGSGYDPLSGNRINERARALEYEQGQIERARSAGWDPLTGAIIENAEATDKATGSHGRFVSAIDEANAAMMELSSTSGDYFSMLRGAKEFNLFEEVFKIGDKLGWSAGAMADFGVAAGLFDQGKANELMNQTYLLQYAEQLIKQGVGAGDLPDIMRGVEQQLADGTLAQEFFAGLDAETAKLGVELNTNPALEQRDQLYFELENAPPAIIPARLSFENDPVASGIVEEQNKSRILE